MLPHSWSSPTQTYFRWTTLLLVWIFLMSSSKPTLGPSCRVHSTMTCSFTRSACCWTRCTSARSPTLFASSITTCSSCPPARGAHWWQTTCSMSFSIRYFCTGTLTSGLSSTTSLRTASSLRVTAGFPPMSPRTSATIALAQTHTRSREGHPGPPPHPLPPATHRLL
eukprot:Rmarinus@m.16826